MRGGGDEHTQHAPAAQHTARACTMAAQPGGRRVQRAVDGPGCQRAQPHVPVLVCGCPSPCLLATAAAGCVARMRTHEMLIRKPLWD